MSIHKRGTGDMNISNLLEASTRECAGEQWLDCYHSDEDGIFTDLTSLSYLDTERRGNKKRFFKIGVVGGLQTFEQVGYTYLCQVQSTRRLERGRLY